MTAAVRVTWQGFKGLIAAFLVLSFLVWWTWKPEPMTVERFQVDGGVTMLFERTVLHEFGSRWTAEVNDAAGVTICTASGISTFTTAESRVKQWSVRRVFGPSCPSPLPVGAEVTIQHYPLGGDLAPMILRAVVE